MILVHSNGLLWLIIYYVYLFHLKIHKCQNNTMHHYRSNITKKISGKKSRNYIIHQ